MKVFLTVFFLLSSFAMYESGRYNQIIYIPADKVAFKSQPSDPWIDEPIYPPKPPVLIDRVTWALFVHDVMNIIKS